MHRKPLRRSWVYGAIVADSGSSCIFIAGSKLEPIRFGRSFAGDIYTSRGARAGDLRAVDLAAAVVVRRVNQVGAQKPSPMQGDRFPSGLPSQASWVAYVYGDAAVLRAIVVAAELSPGSLGGSVDPHCADEEEGDFGNGKRTAHSEEMCSCSIRDYDTMSLEDIEYEGSSSPIPSLSLRCS